MLEELNRLPSSYKKDIEKAVKILKEEGCKEVFLFGSIVEGNIQEDSDIDLAVKGCPSGKYFNLIGKLMLELGHPIDLVNLDKNDDFASFLFREKELYNVQ